MQEGWFAFAAFGDSVGSGQADGFFGAAGRRFRLKGHAVHGFEVFAGALQDGVRVLAPLARDLPEKAGDE